MKDSAFASSSRFLEQLIEQHPENQLLIDLYGRLLEFKNEYDLESIKLIGSEEEVSRGD